MRSVLVCSAIASLLASTLAAQQVEPGAVIRVQRPGSSERFVGTLVTRTPDTLTLAPKGGGVIKLPAASVRSIEVSMGRRRFLPAAKWAAIGGGIWGVVASVVPYEPCDPARYSNCNEANSMSRSEFVGTQILGVAIITGAIGAIRGDEAWTRVEGSADAAFVRPSHGGTAVGLRLRL